MSTYALRLYVTGSTPRTRRAIANVQRMCDEDLDGQCDLEVVDVLEHPHVALEENIVATPTLVKESPPPVRRIVGDLSQTHEVLRGLDLSPRARRGGGAVRPSIGSARQTPREAVDSGLDP